MRSRRLAILATVLAGILYLPNSVVGQDDRACDGRAAGPRRGSDNSSKACASRANTAGESLRSLRWILPAYRLPGLSAPQARSAAVDGDRVWNFAGIGATLNLRGYASARTNYSSPFALLGVRPTTTTPDNWLGGNANWSTAGDWSAGVPGSSSAVTIGKTSNGFVTEDLATASAASLSLLSGNALRVAAGNTLTVGGATTIASGGELLVGDSGSGGSTLNSGSLTNAGSLQVGNGGMTSASTLNVTGTLNNAGGTVYVEGGSPSGANALLNVSGAAPSTLTGSYQIYGSTGSAAVEFGSGGITSIGDGSRNSGYVLLDGSNSYLEVGAVNSNNALSGLKTIASNGELDLQNGAAVSTTGGLTNNNLLRVDDGGSGGTTMTIGGSLTNSGYLQMGNGGTTSASTVKVTGTLNNAGGTVSVEGGSTSAANALLNVSGAATSTLTGSYQVYGSTGSAAVEFGSGGITSIGNGSSNSGYVLLDGANAYLEVGSANNNNALNGLKTIASNGELDLQDGAAVTTTGGLANNNLLRVDDGGNGGSSVNIGGSLTNSGYLQMGNGGMTSASTVKVTGTLNNAGGTVSVEGGSTSAADALLSVSGAASSTLTGSYEIYGSTGSAAVEFGSGGVISIGDGSSNSGYVLLDGSNAYLEVGSANSNNALNGLKTIASNGELELQDGAAVTTTGGLTNSNQLRVDGGGNGGSSLSIGGSVTNSGSLQVGDGGMSSASKVTVSGTLNNTGGTVYVEGGNVSGANSLLNVSGAAPSTLTGSYQIYGSTGSATVEFGSGGVTSIGDGSSNSGYVLLDGANAYLEMGAVNSNNALNGLKTIASNGELDLQDGAAVTTTGGLTNSNQLRVDAGSNGGSSMSIGGSLTNSGSLQVGNNGMTSASKVTVSGTLNNTGGTVYVEGGNVSGANALLKVSGAAPSTLAGSYVLYGSSGSAAVEFGSGGVTNIGDGKSNSGSVLLSGSNAYMEVGAVNSNSALSGLKTIASNGELNLQNGASVSATGALTNSGQLEVDSGGNGGSSLSIGGSLTNNGSLQVGNDGSSLASTLKISGPSLTNTGTINLSGGGGIATLEIGGSKVTFGGTGTINLSNSANNLITGTATTDTLVNSGNTIQGAGTIANIGVVNSGTILANQSTPLVIAPSSIGLNNTGTLSVNAGSTLQITGTNGGSLLNFSGTTLIGGTYVVGGTLQFGASGASIITNAANITLSGPSSQIVDLSGGNVLTNLASNTAAGSFTVIGGRNFTTKSNFTNNGTLGVGAGSTVVVNGNLTNFSGTTLTGGTYNVGGTLQFNGANVVTDAANISLTAPSGQIINQSGVNALANLATITAAGSLSLSGGTNFTTAGNFTNNGSLTVASGGKFLVNGNLTNLLGTTLAGGTYNVGGVLQFNGANIVADGGNISLTSNSAEIVNQTSGNALANLATIVGGSFSLSGGANFNTAGKFNNAGTLSVASGSSFVVNGNLANFVGTTLTGGVYSVGGTLQFNGANIVTNAANMTLTGPSAQIIDQTGTNGLTNFANNASSGKFTLTGGQNLSIAGASFSNAGIFTIGAGSTFTVGNGGSSGNAISYNQSAGTTTLDGTLAAASTTSGAQLNLNGGGLFGTGTIGSTTQLFAVSDSSTVTPGDSSTSTGKLTIDGTYTQAASGALDISVAGKTAGTQYDQLDASGTASLVSGTTLNVKLLNGFVPAVGTTFDILNASSLSGTFTNVNGLSINSSEHFSVSYNGNDVVLTVVSGAVSSSKVPLVAQLRWPIRYGIPRIGYIPLRHLQAAFSSHAETSNWANAGITPVSLRESFNLRSSSVLQILHLPGVTNLAPTSQTSSYPRVPTVAPIMQVANIPVVPTITPVEQIRPVLVVVRSPEPQAIHPRLPGVASGLGLSIMPETQSTPQLLSFSGVTVFSEVVATGLNRAIRNAMTAAQSTVFSKPDFNSIVLQNRTTATALTPCPACAMRKTPHAAGHNVAPAKNFGYHLELLSILSANPRHFMKDLLNPNGNEFGYLMIR